MGFIIRGFMFCVILCVFFFVLRFLVGKVRVDDREKGSGYECGFEPMGPTRVSFSLRFFLVAVVFLVFDLEVVLLFPCVVGGVGSWVFILLVWVFLFILGVGLGYEWCEGALEWEE